MTMNPVKATKKLELFLAWLDSESIADADAMDDEIATAEDLMTTQEPHALPEKDGVDLQATKRIIRRLMRISFEDLNSADLNPIFAQGSSPIFAYICTLLHLPVEFDGRVTKRAAFDHLIASVSSSLYSLFQSNL